MISQQTKQALIAAKVVHADETGININAKRHWLHSLSNNQWTYFYPHEKRGTVAMDEMAKYIRQGSTLPITIDSFVYDNEKDP